MKKPVAEFFGTFALVLLGCGAVVIGGLGSGPTGINVLGIAFAFGLAIVAMAYGIGPVSGCHVNPARSLGPAIVGAGAALAALGQVWLFIVAPLIGGGAAGILFKTGQLAADEA